MNVLVQDSEKMEESGEINEEKRTSIWTTKNLLLQLAIKVLR